MPYNNAFQRTLSGAMFLLAYASTHARFSAAELGRYAARKNAMLRIAAQILNLWVLAGITACAVSAPPASTISTVHAPQDTSRQTPPVISDGDLVRLATEFLWDQGRQDLIIGGVVSVRQRSQTGRGGFPSTFLGWALTFQREDPQTGEIGYETVEIDVGGGCHW